MYKYKPIKSSFVSVKKSEVFLAFVAVKIDVIGLITQVGRNLNERKKKIEEKRKEKRKEKKRKRKRKERKQSRKHL